MPLFERDYRAWQGWVDRKIKSLLKKFGKYPELDLESTTRFLREDGTFIEPPGADGVPYTGATQDLDMGLFATITDSLKVSLTPKTATRVVGETLWNPTEGTLETVLLNNTVLQHGQEIHIYGKATEAISNGDAVQLVGTQGNHITIKKAVPSEIKTNPYKYLGVSTENIANRAFGYVTYFGMINNVFTTGWTVGDSLYVDMVNIGKLTNVEPNVSVPRIRVGSVLRLATGASENGRIAIRPVTFSNIYSLENQTLVVGSWVLDVDKYVYTFSNDIITSKRIVDVVPAIASLDIIKAAEMYPNTLSENGTVKLYCKNAPTGDIVVTFNIFG